MDSNSNQPEMAHVKKPGVCIPWEDQLKELPSITGDTQLPQKVWEDIDQMGYTYIWHCLVSF